MKSNSRWQLKCILALILFINFTFYFSNIYLYKNGVVSVKYPKSQNILDNRIFSESSPFNIKIPENVAIDSFSESYVNAITDSFTDMLVVALGNWSVPIFFADSSTTSYDVNITDPNWGFIMDGVPIPDNAAPDPEEDGHMCIIDNSSGIEYDFWQAEKQGNTWSASWGNNISIYSTGTYPWGAGARASGFALTAGLILPKEFEQGIIDHALVFSLDPSLVKQGGPILPATDSDGYSSDPFALPEGARLQLDPSINLDYRNLTSSEKIIAKVLQEYGMILGDIGGGSPEIYAANPIGDTGGWENFLSVDSDGLVYLFEDKISIAEFRVLKMSQQYPNPPDDPWEDEPLPPYEIYITSPESIPGYNTSLFFLFLLLGMIVKIKNPRNRKSVVLDEIT